MQHAAGVGESHRVANAEEETQTVRERMDGLDVLVEALAFDKLHGVEDTAIGERTDVMNGDDAGMLEASEDAGLAVETEREVAVGSGNVEDLESHAALQHLVLRGVDDAHAAARDTLEQAITRSREVRRIGAFTQALEGFVGEKFHGEPRRARW